MKVCILSDARLPTAPDYPGHGLGAMVSAVARGLAAKGHEVTLFAGAGSTFAEGTLKIETDERSFARHDLTGFEVVMDNTHGKITRHIKGLPVIQVSHDREARPSAQAVFPTQAHALYHGFNRTNARIVYNGVDVQDVQADSNGYFAYLSTFHTAKGARGAMQAAELAGVKLVMAGGSPPAPPPGSNYIGPLAGEYKLKFLAGATALLFPSAIEAGPVTVLEAESVGCPVIVSRFGGASENMCDGLTGFTVSDTSDMVDKIAAIGSIKRENCKRWIAENRSRQQMIDRYESLLQAVAAGERW